MARVEEVGPVTLPQLRRLFGNAKITVQPVFDPSGVSPVDAYEVPARMRTALHLRTPADVFPYGVSLSRGMDLDHSIPYVLLSAGGSSGQTRLDNMAPLVRFHHRVRTFGGWHLVQPEAGTLVWRSPTGHVFVVNADGTHALGADAFAQAVWRTSVHPARAPADAA